LKILLVTPPSSEKERYGKLSAVGTMYPPLGLAYIAAAAESRGHETAVVDSEAMAYSFEDIYNEIDKFNPDLVGMSTYLNTIQRCFIIADEIKKRFPRVKVVLGGVQVTVDSNEAIARDSVDFIVRGEGDNVFPELLAAIEGQMAMKDVAGLTWKDNGSIVSNKPQDLIKDLDSLPFPARHLFPMKLYHASAQIRGKNTLHLMTSRGCPFRCAYCMSHRTFGKTYRYHSAQRVIEEILMLKEKYGVDGIQFYDESFTLNRKRVIELCDKMLEHKLRLPWTCFTRVNLVDKPLLDKMKTAGCYQIFYGVEAATQRLLDLIRKDITLEQIENAFKWTKQAKIEALASFMIGLPTETEEEAYKTIDLAIKLDADYAQWAKTTPFPGIEMYDICKKHGKMLTEDFTKFTGWNELVYVTDGRTKEDILKVEKEAFRRFYLRPRYLIKRFFGLMRLHPKKVFNLIRSGLRVFWG